MRKDNSEKKRKRLIILFSLLIIGLMVFSIFALYVENTTDTNINYEGFNIKMTDKGYAVRISDEYITFDYHPSDVDTINISKEIFSTINNTLFIVMTFNPNESVETLAYIDLMRSELEIQSVKTGKPVYFGITQESDKYVGFPIITCQNASSQMPIIYINSSSERTFTSITEDNNCISMNGKWRDLIALKDRLLYALYGVIKQP